ncbi:RNA-binding protein L-like [Oryza brachyantha]|uniref:RNA-binding protein L-like n=1 Tax=Oryza brachyantha TaxID=4533 RepID=UPI001AD983DA|nr:RNA-binding protein L-like [Oryza brachyantha]
MPPQGWAMAPPYYYHGGSPPPAPPLPPKEKEEEEQQQQQARSLWIGGLLPWMDEGYLSTCFTRSPELMSVVIKRNKQTGQSDGYGFLNFADHASAHQILHSYNGQEMPNSDRDFRLNWVTTAARVPNAPNHAIYVGDLAYDVTDFMLHHVFKSRYPSVKSAKVISDKLTGHSKGYGFVFFGDANEHRQAITQMNGAYCSTRPMRIGTVPNKKVPSHDTEVSDSDCNPDNSKLFIGSIDPSVTDEDLKQTFSPYGDLVHVKVIVGKQCGFIKYSSRASAEEAIRMLNGSQLAGRSIRVSWCRPLSNKQDPNKQSYTSHQGYGYDQQQVSVQ